MRNFPRTSVLTLALLSSCCTPPSFAATYAYRGELSDRGVPAEGNYGFRLTFYAGSIGGAPIAPPTTLEGIAVRAGAFSAELDLDRALAGRDSAWLEVQVRDATGVFVPLAERTEVRPKETAAGVCWDTQGNTGTNGITDFLGTLDDQPLSFRVGNTRGLRLEPTLSGPPNVIAGATSNAVTTLAYGAAIGGGTLNVVNDTYGAVAGGQGNRAGDGDTVADSAQFATVGGGFSNVAFGALSTVAGGNANWARGAWSVSPGGQFNCAGGAYSFAGGYAAKVRPGAADQFGPCFGVELAPGASGDVGTFLWNDRQGPAVQSSGANQFLAYATGGVGFNTNAVGDATVSIANTEGGFALPSLRIFNFLADQILGGRVLISENGASSAGGYMNYDAFNNVFSIGTNTGSADVSTLRMSRGVGRVGVGRTPTANALEVEGDASKTTATAWLANSDARIKQEIEPISNALETLRRVHPVTFRYTDAYRDAHPSIEDRRYYNVVAQEFAAVFPDAVKSSREALPGQDGEGILQVDVHPALITTIAATQELADKLAALADRLESLERENAQLREHVVGTGSR